MRVLKLADRTIDTALPAFVMGIINVTPDSFWQMSRVANTDQATDLALKMIEQGADILDIGAESSRPGSHYVSEEEELERIIPVIQAIRKKTNFPISVDTRKKAVFQRAFDAGADILNDISALEDDANLGMYCAQKKCPVILMHKRGNPLNMQKNTEYTNVVQEVLLYLNERKEYASACGISSDKIFVDVGIGFAKDVDANFDLIKNVHFFAKNLECPVLIGLSRKSFLAHCGCSENRLAASLAANMLAVQSGASIIRVHDVQETVDMLSVLHRSENFNMNKEI